MSWTLHLLVLALALHAVVHHHVAERARDRDALGAGGDAPPARARC